jgi:hypothetical protein
MMHVIQCETVIETLVAHDVLLYWKSIFNQYIDYT